MRWRGVTSLLVWLLAYAALDDITTDNATRFPAEYSFLVLSGVWFASLGAWLLGRRRTGPGLASLAAVAIGVVAFWSLPHRGGPMRAVNLLGWVPMLWFLALTGWLLVARRDVGPTTRLGLEQAGDFNVPRPK